MVLDWVPMQVLGSDVIIQLPHDMSELEGMFSPLRKFSPQCVSAGDPGPPASAPCLQQPGTRCLLP